MLLVQKHISAQQQNLKNHPFFQTLTRENNFLDTMSVMPKLTFWVMTFQDVLRLTPLRIESKALRRIATHHKIEDAGHDQWFLQDIAFLTQKSNDISWLFGKENELVRFFSYDILSEILTISSDYLRVILILTLESTGHIFFENIAKFVNSHGYESHLKYFSSYHLEVEHNHAIFEEQLNQEIFKIKLSSEDRSQAIDLVDRVYQGFNKVFDYLNTSLTEKYLPEDQNEQEHLVA